MLCRCSQQERVIAVGVWSSPRRFGSSGQSCQKLPKDPPGYTRVLLPGAGPIFVWRFILHVLQIHSKHICERARAPGHQRRPSLDQFIDSCIRPTCWLLDNDSGVPGTCQRHHARPQDPASFSTLGQQPCHERRRPRDTLWRLRGHGRKKIRQIGSHLNENFN